VAEPVTADRASDLAGGIVIYEHANYGGKSAHVTEDVKHLGDFRGHADRSAGRAVYKESLAASGPASQVNRV
jgi:hypothetical protein